MNAVSEAIDIGRQAGTPVIISHHKVAGKKNWGESVETLGLIDQVNQEGIEVSLDQYPYKVGATGLKATIPPEFHEGGTEKLIESLKDADVRAKIKNVILDPEKQWENLAINCGFDGILVLNAKGAPEARG